MQHADRRHPHIKLWFCRHPRAYSYEIRDAFYHTWGRYVTDLTMRNALHGMGFSHKKRIKCALEKFTPQIRLLDTRFR